MWSIEHSKANGLTNYTAQIDQNNRIERCLEFIKQQAFAIRGDVEVINQELKRRDAATKQEISDAQKLALVRVYWRLLNRPHLT